MKFSIITCTYNSLDGLKATVKQLKRQVGPNVQIEHVVIDGGSSDHTEAWLNEEGFQSDQYMMRWVSEPDQGLYDALNKGMHLATGDVIGILHTDDVWEEGVLQLVSNVLASSPSVDGVYGDLLYVSAEDVTKIKRVWRSGKYAVEKWWNGWMPPHPALFVRQEFAKKVGDYRLDFGSAGDYEWMLRAALVHQAELGYVPETLVRMRVGGQSNVSIKARLSANTSDRRAWEANGIRPKVWTLWMKPLRKLPQWFRK